MALMLSSATRAPRTLRQALLEKHSNHSLSPATEDLRVAPRWFHLGVALDGVIAKRRDLDYRSGERTGMQKIRHSTPPTASSEAFAICRKTPFGRFVASGSVQR